VTPRKTIIAILATLSASLALAEDFKTVNGKEYKNVTVTSVEADGMVGLSVRSRQIAVTSTSQVFHLEPQ